MANTLVSAYDLEDFPGAPFADSLVDAAVADIRAEAGWHIAPVVTETIRLTSYAGETRLQLPSRRVLTVTAVRDVSTDTPVVLLGWTRFGSALVRPWVGWPDAELEVDLRHGLDATPADLLPLIATRARSSSGRDPSVQQVTTTRGPFTESTTYRADGVGQLDPAIARYALLPGLA